jgi:hypothetical protein
LRHPPVQFPGTPTHFPSTLRSSWHQPQAANALQYGHPYVFGHCHRSHLTDQAPGMPHQPGLCLDALQLHTPQGAFHDGLGQRQPPQEVGQCAQLIAVCRRAKWSKPRPTLPSELCSQEMGLRPHTRSARPARRHSVDACSVGIERTRGTPAGCLCSHPETPSGTA